MFTLVIFIAILAVLVLSHEFGHFIAARKNGIKVDEFGFGFPPRIFGIQFFKEKNANGKKWRFVWGDKGVEKLLQENGGQHSTVYSVNWLPLGGFVKIKGENGEEKNDPDSFGSKKAWRRAIVLAAGVIMNILLAGVLLSIGFMVGLPQMVDSLPGNAQIKNRHIEIVQVLSGKPAEKAGLVAGDTFVKVGTLENPRLKEMQDYVDAHRQETIPITIKRGEEMITKSIQPIVYEDSGRGGLGVSITEVGLISYPWYKAIYYGFLTAVLYLKEIVLAFALMIKGLFSGSGVAGEVTGPVGIAVMTGKVARLGFAYLIQFTAVLSLNLAIVNILPLPALDGGRLLFLLIAKIRGKENNQKIEQWSHMIGFALLLLLIVLVTVKDLGTFSSNILGFFQRLF